MVLDGFLRPIVPEKEDVMEINHFPKKYIGCLFHVFIFIFLCNIAQAEQLSWVKRAGGTSSEQVEGIGLDDNNNIYVMGDFVGPSTFGEGDPHVTILTGDGATYDHYYQWPTLVPC